MARTVTSFHHDRCKSPAQDTYALGSMLLILEDGPVAFDLDGGTALLPSLRGHLSAALPCCTLQDLRQGEFVAHLISQLLCNDVSAEVYQFRLHVRELVTASQTYKAMTVMARHSITVCDDGANL